MNKYFQQLQDMFSIQNDDSKWKNLRMEVFQHLSQTSHDGKGKKSFYEVILDEVKNELKEDSEKCVLEEAREKYEQILATGYFKINIDGSKPRGQEEGDIIP